MVISIKKRVLGLATVIAVLLVTLVVGIGASPAQADPCQTGEVKVVVVGSGLSICVPLDTLPTVTVTLPNITNTVTLPRITSIKTATKTVSLKKTATVTRTVRSTATVIQRVPGPVSTKTKTSYVTRVVTEPRQTVTERATITKPAVTKTATVTVTDHKVDENQIVVTKFKAAGISILLVILGALLAMLLLWAAYTYGWVQGDAGNRRFLREIRDDLKYKD